MKHDGTFSYLSLTVTAPRIHISSVRQSQDVLTTNSNVLDEHALQSRDDLWPVMILQHGIGQTYQTLCENRVCVRFSLSNLNAFTSRCFLGSTLAESVHVSIFSQNHREVSSTSDRFDSLVAENLHFLSSNRNKRQPMRI